MDCRLNNASKMFGYRATTDRLGARKH